MRGGNVISRYNDGLSTESSAEREFFLKLQSADNQNYADCSKIIIILTSIAKLHLKLKASAVSVFAHILSTMYHQH